MIIKGVKELVAEAEAEIENMAVEEVIKAIDDPDIQLVDLRDIRELWRDGAIPSAIHSTAWHAGILGRSGKPLSQGGLRLRQEIHLFLWRRISFSPGNPGGATHGPRTRGPYRWWI